MSMINRQKLIEAVEKEYYKFIDDDRDVAHNRAIYDVIEIVKSQPTADVPDTNVGEITKAQVIEALKTLKTYCDQRDCDSCPLCDWCWYDREHLTPDDWQIPQERTKA